MSVIFFGKMTTLMITDDETVMLQVADFPDFFIDKHHPDDYVISKEPVRDFYFHKMPLHNRLILRMSVRLKNDIYIPFTFICDTGAPSYIYINDITRRLIKERITEDDVGNQFLYIHGKRLPVFPSSDTNIIGLMALAYFGLYIQEDSFGFMNLPEYL